MSNTKQIEIPLSKGKLSLMLIGSIVFIAIGVWFITNYNEVSTRSTFIYKNPVLIFAIGVAAILFFGLCAFSISRRITSDSSGLIINEQGITDNSSGIASGLISWVDIKTITKERVANQNFIIIIVNDPEKYINRQNSFIKRKAMMLNLKSYGSPISISANGLKCTFTDLYTNIVDRFDAYKRETQNKV